MEYRIPEVDNRVRRLEDILEKLINDNRIVVPQEEKNQIFLELDKTRTHEQQFAFTVVENRRKTQKEVRERVSRIAPPLGPHIVQHYFENIPYYNGQLFDPEHETDFEVEEGAAPGPVNNWNIELLNPLWTEYARDKSNAEWEADLIMWLNRADLVVDWKATMNKFDAVLNIEKQYTEGAMVDCLKRMANYFEKIQTEQLAGKTANQIATILINLQKPADIVEHLRAKLSATTRDVGETISKAVQKAELVIQQLYPKEEDAYMRKTLYMQAILAFSHDKVVKAYNHNFQKILNKNLFFNKDRYIRQIEEEEAENNLKISMAQRFDRLDNPTKKFQLNNIVIDKRLKKQLATPFQHKSHKDLYSKAQNFVRKRDRKEFGSDKQYNEYIMDYKFHQDRIENARERENREAAQERERQRRLQIEQALREEDGELTENTDDTVGQDNSGNSSNNDRSGNNGDNGAAGAAANVNNGDNTSVDGRIHPPHASTPIRPTNSKNQNRNLSNIQEESTSSFGTADPTVLVADDMVPNIREDEDSTLINVDESAPQNSRSQVEYELNRSKRHLSTLTKQIHDSRKVLASLSGQESIDKQNEIDMLNQQRHAMQDRMTRSQLQHNIQSAMSADNVRDTLEDIRKFYKLGKDDFRALVETLPEKAREELDDALEGQLDVTPNRVLNTVFQTANNRVLEEKVQTRQSKLFNLQSEYGYVDRNKDTGTRRKTYSNNKGNSGNREPSNNRNSKNSGNKDSSKNGNRDRKDKSQNRDSRKDNYNKKKDRNGSNRESKNTDKQKNKKDNRNRSSSQPRAASTSSYHSSRDASASSAASGTTSRETSNEDNRSKSKEKYKRKIRDMAKELKGYRVVMANMALAKESPLKCKKCKKAMHPGQECEPLVNVTEMTQQLMEIANTLANTEP